MSASRLRNDKEKDRAQRWQQTMKLGSHAVAAERYWIKGAFGMPMNLCPACVMRLSRENPSWRIEKLDSIEKEGNNDASSGREQPR